MGCRNPNLNNTATNSLSVRNNPQAAISKINEEIALGRVAGPFDSPPFKTFNISPLALREKKNSAKVRLLHNLSAPHNGNSVNANIPDEAAHVKYQSLLDAISIIVENNCNYLAKSDIAEAYRLIPLHHSDHPLMGFKLNNKFYYDKCLPMGCRSSCAIFETFSDALVDILKSRFNVRHVVKILDDFLFLAPSHLECAQALEKFRLLARFINLPIADHKTSGPSTAIEFLGITLDTEKRECRLPPDKLADYSEELKSLGRKKFCTIRQLKSMAGKLSFASTVIMPGRTFIRRVYDAMCGHHNSNALVKLGSGCRKDLEVWQNFLENFNGKTFFKMLPAFDKNPFQLYTDSSGYGYGGILHPSFIQGVFPPSWLSFNIQILELYPILSLLEIFKAKLAGRLVMVNCDNAAIVHSLNKLSSKNKFVMSLIRKIVIILLLHNIRIKAVHIPGKQNYLADFLSRKQASWDLTSSFGLAPSPTQVPGAILPQNLSLD